MSVPTLAQVANVNGWLDNGVAATISTVERKMSKKNRPFWVVMLQDPTGPEMAEWCCFTAPSFKAGDVLEITGKGVKIEDGQYGLKISSGKDAVVTVVGQSAHHEEQQQRKSEGAPAVNGKPQHVLGQTVGMAIKEAITLVKAAFPDRGAHNDPDFWKGVKQTASNIIRISQSLEGGHLSPPSWPIGSTSVGTPPAPPPKPAAPPPPPASGGRTDPPKPRHQEVDEDVPF